MNALYWHVHHEKLIEPTHDIQERIEYIRANKPDDEIETRLRLLNLVIGPLPKAVDKARAEWGKASAEFDKASAEFDKARAELDKAISDNMPAILALHAVECPNCPWDGRTIFPVKD